MFNSVLSNDSNSFVQKIHGLNNEDVQGFEDISEGFFSYK